MKKFGKILGLLGAFALVICITVSFTVAALTANTGTITNTFVATSTLLTRSAEFTLREHEAVLSQDGNSYELTGEYKQVESQYAGNQYSGLLQGMVLAKDPKVAITANNVTAQSYLFVAVKATDVSGLAYTLNTTAFEDVTAAIEAVNPGDTVVPEGYTVLAYKTKVEINAAVAETSILVGDTVTVTSVDAITSNSSLAFTAYLCQTAGYATPAAAFAANFTLA